ncbi:MAG: YitT family protein [Clostridiales bacterium]|nr:YitT family protein [Candidatus Crickella merdequi]
MKANGLLKNNKLTEKIFLTIVGNLIYAAGNNVCITPLHLYSGGFTGVTQLIRIFLLQVLHLQENGFSYTGIIYFCINAPFFIIAYKVMGKKFLATTVVSIVMSSAFLSLIPIPVVPIIEDPMLASIIGGLGSGIGAGMVLRAGSSQGGQDLLGVCLAKTHPDFKVGTIGIIISICIYTICLVVYDVQTVLYSMIFAVVTGLAIDKVHIQNIKLEALIITKNEGIAAAIMEELRRGVTYWEGTGAYTKQDANILVTVISKYEEPLLKEIVGRVDPNAFVVITDNARVIGNFEKRFTE